MQLPRFEYREAKTTEEACSFLAECQGQAKVLAGGTDLLVMMKQKVLTPRYLLNIKRIPGLDEINEDKDGLRIGPLATLADIASSAPIRRYFPLLAEAAGRVACQQIQTTATIGGNLCLDAKCWYYNQSAKWRKSREACLKRGGSLCHVMKGGKRCYAVLSGDTVSVLLALKAKLTIAGSTGQRVVPVEEFYTGVGEAPNILQPEELVTRIEIPYLPAQARGAFLKHSLRGAIDFALADVAAVVAMEDGVCKEARIAISSIGPMVVRAMEAGEILKGQPLTAEVLEEAGRAAVKEARLVSGAQGSVYYRRKIIHALTKRALKQAAGVS